MTDAEKYQRLAEEFAKVKQHNAILKKAFRDEQERTTKLDADLKAVESRLRTAGEETETLTFNNARLAKRVAVLQEALEEEKEKASKAGGWFGSGAKAELVRVQEQLQVLKDELEVKIKENEELHMRIFETGQETGTIKEDLQERIAKLKADLKSKTEQLDDLTQQHKHTVTRLSTENSSLQARSEELSDTLVRTKSFMQQREHTMTQAQLVLSSERDNALAIIATKLPFNDTAHAHLNVLNLPHFDNARASKLASLASSGLTLFKKFIGFWKDWCDAEHEKMLYLNRSSNDTPDELKQINRRLGSYLDEFPGLLSSITSSFSAFMNSETLSPDSMTHKQDIQLQLQQFIALHEKTSLGFKARLDIEKQCFKMFANNESVRTHNTSLAENWINSHIQVEKIVSYFTIYCGATSERHDASSPSASNALFALQNLASATLELRTLLRDRAALVQQLCNLELQYDAFMSNDVKLINNRRGSALTNATALLDKIVELFSDYVATLAVPSPTVVRGAHCNFGNGLYPLDVKDSRARRYTKGLQSLVRDHRSITFSEQQLHMKQIADLSQALRAKDTDITTLKQQLAQHLSMFEKTTQELRSTKEAFAAQQKGLQDALNELAEVKLKLAQSSSASIGTNDHALDQSIGTSISTSLDLLSGPPPSFSEATSSDSSSGFLSAPPPPSYSTLIPSSTHPPIDLSSASSNPALSLTAFLSMTGQTPAVSSDPFADYRTSSHLGAYIPSIDTSSTSVPPAVADGSTNESLVSSQPSSSFTSKRPWSINVVDDPSIPPGSLLSDQDKEREEQLKRFYEQRVQQFQTKAEATDRKNVELYQQMMDLERRLRETVAQRESFKADLEAAGRKAMVGTDELETTRANYDTQLKTLTEHMVALSDKIASYEEQLSILKNSTVRCGRCKAWNTIDYLIGEGKMGQRCKSCHYPSSFNYA